MKKGRTYRIAVVKKNTHIFINALSKEDALRKAGIKTSWLVLGKAKVFKVKE